jgi:protein-disulfide isomerase
MDSFAACLENGTHVQRVEADIALGEARGVGSTPTFFINGQLLVGAQPLALFNEAIATVQEGGQLASGSQEEPAQPGVAPTPAVFSDNVAAVLGDSDAPVTIVEFSDYQCPYCERHSTETLPQIVATMIETGRARYIFKDMPLDNIHAEARSAAVAARCAGEQEAYWEMHNSLFSRQAEWAGQGAAAEDAYIRIAGDIGLEREAFGACLIGGAYDTAIQANVEEAAALGVSGTPYFFVNGYPLNGARPMEHFEIAVSLAEEGRLAEAFTPAPQPEQPTGPVEVPLGSAYSIGDSDAPVTIVEYTDYQCPYCGRHFEQTFGSLVNDYVESGAVRYVFKDFTPTFQNPDYHPQAILAAMAARCAGDQGDYLAMHDALFARQAEWSNQANAAELFAGYATELGMDGEVLATCIADSRHEAAVLADFEEGLALGVSGTPTFFINGYRIVGAQALGVFEEAIASLAAQAES